MRTCIGCRQRASVADLLRVVAGSDLRLDESGSPVRDVLPDPRHRAGGRGAWLHPRSECADSAERRRTYSRALRCSDRLDPTPVRQYLDVTG